MKNAVRLSSRSVCKESRCHAVFPKMKPVSLATALILILHHAFLSSRLLFEDNDSGLFSVTLFRKAVDDFKHKARENK